MVGKFDNDKTNRAENKFLKPATGSVTELSQPNPCRVDFVPSRTHLPYLPEAFGNGPARPVAGLASRAGLKYVG